MPPQASAGEILLYSGHTLKRSLKADGSIWSPGFGLVLL